MSRKLPTGQWGVPINIGAEINTKFNEDFPVFSSDGETIYFCSQGHNSMGGFDIFKSSWNNETQEWMSPVNLGHPINTPEDNMTISFAGSGTHAYVSAYREDGFGDLDIYKITFNGTDPVVTAIKGTIKAQVVIDNKKYKDFHVYKKAGVIKEFPDEYRPDLEAEWKFVETKKVEVKEGFEIKSILIFEKNGSDITVGPERIPTDPAFKFKDIKNNQVKIPGYVFPVVHTPEIQFETVGDAFITVTNKKTDEVYGNYVSQPTGRFIIIAPPGLYSVLVEAEGFADFSEDILILDKASFQSELEKDIILQKK